MSFFAMPYRVLFHDTMAYGTHHFLTNFKFQCEAREHLFFKYLVDASEEGRAAHESLILLTREGYSRNLAPVAVGEKVVILVSTEDHTPSSVRFCFRVIRRDGVKVARGFQTLVCVSRDSGEVVPAPEIVGQLIDRIPEKLTSPSFAERVLAGKTRAIFDGDIRALALSIAASDSLESQTGFVDLQGRPPGLASMKEEPEPLKIGHGPVFLFPGQGSLDPAFPRALHGHDAESVDRFRQADAITRRLLGKPFLAWVTGSEPLWEDAELYQVGIFSAAVLGASLLQRGGIQPALMVGHSAGELAALAAAGVFEFGAGVEVICRRVLAPRRVSAEAGGMSALFCEESKAASLIESRMTNSLRIAVINHERQVVISGTLADLAELESRAGQAGVVFRRVRGPYPFHSPILASAVAPFASDLASIASHPPQSSVFSPMEGRLMGEERDLPGLLASHFTRPLDFRGAMRLLYRSGARTFIEVGAGKTISGIVGNIFSREEDVRVEAPFAGIGAPVAAPNPPHARQQPEPVPATETRVSAVSAQKEIPIAIIGKGCVLPGAMSPSELWRNILERRVAISDAGERHPWLAIDFKSGASEKITLSDKTYTLLGGYVTDFAPDLAGLPYNPEEFESLSLAQRFLAVATAQCLAGLPRKPEREMWPWAFIGATADGIAEFDEALLVTGLLSRRERLAEDPRDAELLGQMLGMALGREPGDVARWPPYQGYQAVMDRMLGAGVKLLTIDAACASSMALPLPLPPAAEPGPPIGMGCRAVAPSTVSGSAAPTRISSWKPSTRSTTNRAFELRPAPLSPPPWPWLGLAASSPSNGSPSARPHRETWSAVSSRKCSSRPRVSASYRTPGTTWTAANALPRGRPWRPCGPWGTDGNHCGAIPPCCWFWKEKASAASWPTNASTWVPCDAARGSWRPAPGRFLNRYMSCKTGWSGKSRKFHHPAPTPFPA